jgi:hypothetical protein
VRVTNVVSACGDQRACYLTNIVILVTNIVILAKCYSTIDVISVVLVEPLVLCECLCGLVLLVLVLVYYC